MNCREVMHDNPLTCTTSTTAMACAAAMRDRDIGFVPVVDDEGRVVGTVTDRDLCTRVLAAGKPGTEPLGSIMTQDVISCQPDDDLAEAEDQMARHQVKRIVITDGNAHPLGVISTGDIVERDPDAERTHRLLQAVKHPTPPDQPRA